MANRIIDLRKPSTVQKEQMPALAGLDETFADTSLPATQKNDGSLDIQWSGYEHENRVRGRYWFLYLLIVATVGIIFGAVNHNYLFIIFVVISFVILFYYIKRPPRMRTYIIEKRGIWIDDKLTDYSKLKSFWMYTHPLLASELLLETQNPINVFMYIRLEGVNQEAVKRIISRYLPEKEQKDTALDQIARIIGF